jgi:hypothetical protein
MFCKPKFTSKKSRFDEFNGGKILPLSEKELNIYL